MHVVVGTYSRFRQHCTRDNFPVMNLLYRHGAVVDVQGELNRTPLHAASYPPRVDIMRWLLDHGADANARTCFCYTPLSAAVTTHNLEAVQVLLEHNADVNLQNIDGQTPLYGALTGVESKAVRLVRRLLEHGADPNIFHKLDHSTPLHAASSRGWLEAARLLLSYGAKVDEKDDEGRTPLQVAGSKGHEELTKLLLEHGAVAQP